LTAVALFLTRYHAVRQRLREFYQETAAKKGASHRELDVTACLAPLLRWVLRDWDDDRLAVAVASSFLGTRLAVLCVAVVCRGALPVAWAILPATSGTPGSGPG
jgi:hypothetical protein